MADGGFKRSGKPRNSAKKYRAPCRNRLERAQKRDRTAYRAAVRRFARAVSCAGISTAPNATYGHADLVQCVVRACVRNRNVASAAEAKRHAKNAGRYERGRVIGPCGEWFRRVLSKISAWQAVSEFERFTKDLIAQLQEHGLLKDALDLAIDYHNIRRFDKKPGPELVRGGDKDKRKKEFYETYATIQCIVAGQRLVLGIAPYVPGDDHAGSVKALLETVARHGLKVGTVMLDRGFYSTDVFSLLQESGHRWLMPCPNSLHVKEALAEYGAGRRAKVSKCVITQSSKKECEYDMVAAPREAKRKKKDGEELEPWEKYIAFATNDPEIDVTEYANRWGIETGYRQAEDARAKTRSKSHGPRVMCWAMTLMLFNAWVFVDAMRRLECAAYCTRHAIPLHSALSAIEAEICSVCEPPK